MSCSRSPRSCAASLPCGISTFGGTSSVPCLMVRKRLRGCQGVCVCVCVCACVPSQLRGQRLLSHESAPPQSRGQSLSASLSAKAAAAAAKSLQSCLTLCNPRDDSPPGTGSLASQRHPGKFPKVPGRRRGTRGFPAAPRQRPRAQGRGSLVGCHLWGRTESDMTEAT